MRESRSYGSVGVRGGNEPLYPEQPLFLIPYSLKPNHLGPSNAFENELQCSLSGTSTADLGFFDLVMKVSQSGTIVHIAIAISTTPNATYFYQALFP